MKKQRFCSRIEDHSLRLFGFDCAYVRGDFTELCEGSFKIFSDFLDEE
jgi:hypothetical protein